MSASVQAKLQATRDYLATGLMGRELAVERALVCMAARGHLLIEDVPGVGKTTLGACVSTGVWLGFQARANDV